MSFPDLSEELRTRLPGLRGRLTTNAPLSEVTWFRVGGPAQVLFSPADAEDLAYVLGHMPSDMPVTVIGLGSNLLVRDGGIPGMVIRLGRGFTEIKVEEGSRLRVGAAVPDVQAARAAAKAGIAGLSFLRGIPGSIGGALRMNAGAHGSETKDHLVEATLARRSGRLETLSVADLNMTYRHSGAPTDAVFTEAVFQGTPGDPAEIEKAMQDVAEYRERNQPIKERTGGSTFKNPTGSSAWKLVDQAGCRGFRIGGAKVSEMHCNFLINDAGATAEDIERLGETVRARVRAATGTMLEWEIIRLGVPRDGRPTGEALVDKS